MKAFFYEDLYNRLKQKVFIVFIIKIFLLEIFYFFARIKKQMTISYEQLLRIYCTLLNLYNIL